MERRRKVSQMPPHEIKRELDSEKLVAFILPPRRVQRRVAAPIKPRSQGLEDRGMAVEGHLATAGQVQADFHAAGMKALAPIKCLATLEVMPLEAGARGANTAMQMLPTRAHRTPHRTFRKALPASGSALGPVVAGAHGCVSGAHEG